jgi:Uma2 family endonuclease
MTQQLRTTRPSKTTGHAPVRMTYRQFLERDGNDNHVEWVNGELVMMAPISDEHDDVAGLLYSLLRAYVETHALGVVKHDPYQMKTGPKLPGRAPDVLFLAKKHLARKKKTHIEGPADVVIEVISTGSRGVDHGDKFYEYEKGGVKEYWLIDPERKRAEFYGLGRNGTFQLLPVEQDVFRSPTIKGLWIRVPWLWQRPLPLLIDLQKQMGLV